MTDEVVDPDTGEVLGMVIEEKRPIVPAQATAQALAAAEQSRALVQARVLVALQRPRDYEEVRRRLLNDCKRVRFAEAARYAKPMGDGKARGWSIRFAEAAVRAMGNIDVRTQSISEDEDKLVLRVDAIDLETNASFGGDITITKTVERRRLRQDEKALKVRTNSKGQPTYTVRANEDDMLTKTAAHISKAIRTYALRHVPADILEDCADQIRKASDSEDPAKARKRIVDAFGDLGVGPADVKKIAGQKDLTLLTSEQLTHLRETYTAIKEGDLSVAELLAQVNGGEEDKAEDPKSTSKSRLKEKLAKNREPGEDG